MKAIVLFIFIVAVPATSKSQDIDFERWEVGIDLLPLLNRHQISPSLFIKKLDLKQKQKGTGFIRRGYRLRTGIVFSSTPDKSPYYQNFYDVFIRPGYEWDWRIKSIDVLFALDGILAFNKNMSTDYYVNSQTYIRYTENIFGISPVAGVSYPIFKNFRISAESAIDVCFRNLKQEFVSQSVDHGTISKNGMLVRIYPLYVLNAVFVF